MSTQEDNNALRRRNSNLIAICLQKDKEIFGLRETVRKHKQWITQNQIEEVIRWMNTWEQLKDTVIPIRFKEDFSKRYSIHSMVQLKQKGMSKEEYLEKF